MSDRQIHLPSWKGRPACGVRRGIMALEVDGVRTVDVGGVAAVEFSRATQPHVTCRRCLDAMLRHGSPFIRQQWRMWLAAEVGGNAPDAAPGCSYMMRIRRDDDAPVSIDGESWL